MIKSVQDKKNGSVICACSSVVERFSDKEEVDGSIPSRRTNKQTRAVLCLREEVQSEGFWFESLPPTHY